MNTAVAILVGAGIAAAIAVLIALLWVAKRRAQDDAREARVGAAVERVEHQVEDERQAVTETERAKPTEETWKTLDSNLKSRR